MTNERKARIAFWGSAAVAGALFATILSCCNGGADQPKTYGDVITPPGIARVVTNSPGLLAGSGTTSNPLTATISTSGLISGTGSAGSPITSSTAVANTRNINTTSPLAGGGNLSADRTLSINANGITDSFLRQGAGVSVIGRAANSTGNVADIVAASDGQVLTRASGALVFADPGSVVAPAVPYMGLFGDGSDGALVFDGTSTITLPDGTSMVPDANKRYTVPRDLLGTNITINTGVVVIPENADSEKGLAGSIRTSRIFCTGTLTVTGKIRNAGAGKSTALITGHGTGTTTSGSVVITDTTGGSSPTGGVGSLAGVGGAAGAAAQHYYYAQTAVAGGTAGNAGANATGAHLGGGGGASATFAGGAGGATTLPTSGATTGATRDIRALTTGTTLVNTAVLKFGGTGGGGGGYSGTSGQGGGNGAGGGGVIVVLCKFVTGGGSIEAPGGDGADGASGGTGAGGGGGGGGGTIIILTTSTSSLPSTNVNGGTGGTGGGASGKNGGNGSNGKVFLLNN